MIPCGAIHAVLRVNRGSVDMFAYSQTNVFLHANECLTMGKHANGASIAPQGIPLCSSRNIPWFFNQHLVFPRFLFYDETIIKGGASWFEAPPCRACQAGRMLCRIIPSGP
jgi:hypothetical protein